MIYGTETKRLYTDDGQFIKEMHCPLATKLARTVSAAEPDRSFRCMHCRTELKDLAYLSDGQVLGAAKQNPSVCFFSTQAAQNVAHISTPRQGFCFRRQAHRDKVQGSLPIPVVRTARALEEMNFAAANGFRLLVQQAGSGRRLRRFVGVYRTTETGALHLCNDYRQAHDIAWVSAQPDPKEVGGEHCEFVIPMFLFIPQGPASPVAAYLIPEDLPDNAEVFVEDVIEDKVRDYPQGTRVRTEYWFATWTGKDLVFVPEEKEMVLG